MGWLNVVLTFIEQNPAIVTDIIGLFVKHPTLAPTIAAAYQASKTQPVQGQNE
jgi:hypothetical protein